ncbi:WAT1-related protein At3g28050-like isoform X1 [Juglans microcarpa x Juglans regia]|uniref:WAT1-related protein At3g28050-like isoform X1 n=1 Tax=Juglans microcarpa x Juglans regia TaxID=2249226 RepID=UPI001B7E897E|nr:WAT1-related protein At3g28050-like isoform X1 [Juglans microcarpa x Juglans regia]XP_041010873.1 WAT1-related protein At3g28050-like isoform X1 [Juglans microcarpa x Juglans regia]
MESAALPFVGMIMVEFAQVGLMIVGKVAMSRGMSNLIFIFYSNALASFILLPTSFFFHGSERPPITFSLLCGFFALGLLGFGIQILGYAGILYSSPTLGTAMLNLIPAFTFILAVAFRMEKLDWRSSSSLAKSLGALVSITGAFSVTLYKGLPLLMTPSPSEASHQLLLQMSNWVVGGLLLAADSVLASVWLIMQALILKKYPAGLIVVFFYCFFVAIQSAVVSLVLERDLSSWSLQPNTRLIAVLYSGMFGSAFQVGLSAWCMHKTGPVFVAMFKPVGIFISIVVGVILLGDTFYLGSLIGAILIVIGFFSVMWGKAKEQKMIGEAAVRNFDSSRQKAPLLQNSVEEM